MFAKGSPRKSHCQPGPGSDLQLLFFFWSQDFTIQPSTTLIGFSIGRSQEREDTSATLYWCQKVTVRSKRSSSTECMTLLDLLQQVSFASRTMFSSAPRRITPGTMQRRYSIQMTRCFDLHTLISRTTLPRRLPRELTFPTV